MALALASRARLNNGTEMPWLGLGLWQVPSGRTAERTVAAALSVGYRHFDTAALYGNEADLGRALRASDVPREEVFVTTKLWNSDHGHAKALRAFDRSLRTLGLDYVDLYLILWPVAEGRGESWRALVEIAASGRARAIGVSNYTIPHLEALLGETDVVPAVNQVEFNPFLYQRDLLAFCREHGIQLEAYSPLTKGHSLEDPRLRAVADRLHRTPAQVALRWALQHEVVVIPKTTSPERMRENASLFDFELGPAEMRALDGLDRGLRTSRDPTGAP